MIASVRLSSIGLAVAGAAAFALLTPPGPYNAGAQSPTIGISRTSQVPGGQLTAELSAFDIPPPGLGAWTINITYDPSVVTAVRCRAATGVFTTCNWEFAANIVRVSGADTHGLIGDNLLVRLLFECGPTVASSPLTLSVEVLVDGTVGGPQPIEAVLRHGNIACAPEEPTPSTATPQPVAPTRTATPVLPPLGAGVANSPGAARWPIWLSIALAAAGLASIVGARRSA